LGYEQDGKGQKSFDFYHNYRDVFGNPASGILLQLRMCSPKRFLRKSDVMNDKEFENIKEKIRAFLDG